MPYQIGDPNHLGVHNDLTTAVRSAAARAGVTVTLPDEAHLGDTGHVADHNLLAQALAEIAAAPGGMPWAKVSGGTVTTVTNADGSVDEVHTFTANGTLTVESPGYARVLLVGGGGAGHSNVASLNAGAGGRVSDGILSLPAGALPVQVGVGGIFNNGSDGRSQASKLGSFYVGFSSYGSSGAGETGAATGFTSDITGTAKVYGAFGNGSQANTGNGGGFDNTNGASGVVIVRVQKSAPTVSGVVATGGTVTEYVGDGTNGVLGQRYKVHRFDASGDLVVAQGGSIDYLVVGGGYAPGANGWGGGAVCVEGKATVAAGSVPVVVGASVTASIPPSPSKLGSIAAAASAGWSMAEAQAPGYGYLSGRSAVVADGWKSTITGTLVEYAQGAPRNATTPGSPLAYPSTTAAAGVVIVRYEIP